MKSNQKTVLRSAKIHMVRVALTICLATVPWWPLGAQTTSRANLTTPPNLTVRSGATRVVTGADTGGKVFTGTINNGGTITINKGGTLQIGGPTAPAITLTGGGPLTLAGGLLRGVQIKDRDGFLTATSKLINTNNTISGWGIISTLLLENNATINANVAGQTLKIALVDLDNAGGTLQASNGGTLALSGPTITNSGNNAHQGGFIVANNGSTVNLSNVSVNGGALDTLGTGAINGTGTVSLSKLTINGTYNVGSKTTTSIVGQVRNFGTINVPDGGTINGARLINGNKVNAAAKANINVSNYTQTGGITVADGSIQSPQINIQAGTLTGTGTLTGAVAMGGTLRPGDNAPGVLTINGGIDTQPGSVYQEEIDRGAAGPIACTGPGCYSQLDVSGGTTLDKSTLSVILDSAPELGDLFAIIDNEDSTPVRGTFDGLAQDSTFSVDFGNYAYQFEVSYNGNAISPSDVTFNGGNDVVLGVIGRSAVPEPATGTEFLAGLALLSLGVLRRRRRMA